jgi:hypothetical protein
VSILFSNPISVAFLLSYTTHIVQFIMWLRISHTIIFELKRFYTLIYDSGFPQRSALSTNPHSVFSGGAAFVGRAMEEVPDDFHV